MIRARLAHAAAIIILAISFFVWNDERTSILSGLENAYIKEFSAVKTQEDGYTVVKKLTSNINLQGYAQSSLSADFLSKVEDEQNKSIVKINYVMSRKTFERLEEFKPFIEYTKTDGKNYIVTFIPTNIGSDLANGYKLFYKENNLAYEANTEFLQKIALLIAFGLFIKVGLMGYGVYAQLRKKALQR